MTASRNQRFRVQVPASSSNLGSGFDVFSVALNLYLEVEVDRTEDSQLTWDPEWQGGDNVLESALRLGMEHFGCQLPGLEIRSHCPIPLRRGMGSSGAAIVAGLKIAEQLCGRLLDQRDFLRLALRLEDHPDNVAASLLGGWTLSVTSPETVVALSLPTRLDCRFVIAIPEIEISTREAREILPKSIPMADAVFNMQRCSLLVHAIESGDASALRTALQDRVHQPYRLQLIPGAEALVNREALPAQLDTPLLGVVLSGSGSCLAALVTQEAEAIGDWMLQILKEAGTSARFEVLDVCPEGARIKPCE